MDEVVTMQAPVKVVSVFATDPGETTGWAWISFELKLLKSSGWEDAVAVARGLSQPQFLYGEMDCQDERKAARRLGNFVASSLMRARNFWGSDVLSVLVQETFVLRRSEMDSSLLSPVRMIARIDQEAGAYAERLEGFSANDAKSTCSDERLKRWGLWIPGKKHARDAVRQMLMVMRKMQGEL